MVSIVKIKKFPVMNKETLLNTVRRFFLKLTVNKVMHSEKFPKFKQIYYFIIEIPLVLNYGFQRQKIKSSH